MALEAALRSGDAAAFVSRALAAFQGDREGALAALEAAVLRMRGLPASTPEEKPAAAAEVPLYAVENVQAHTPRGRVSLRFGAKELHLAAKSAVNSVVAPYASVKHVLQVAKPDPYRRSDMAGADYVVLVLDPPAQNGRGKAVPTLLLQVERKGEWKVALAEDAAPPEGCPETLEGSPPDVLARLLELFVQAPMQKPDPAVFTSCQTAAAHVSCYSGVQEGDLWPMPAGVLFLKPPRFVSEDEVLGLGCGRGGSGGSTRYVDLQLTVEAGEEDAGTRCKGSAKKAGQKGGKGASTAASQSASPSPAAGGKSKEPGGTRIVEFTNIDRRELPGLEAYVQWLQRKRAADNATFEDGVAAPADTAKKEKLEEPADGGRVPEGRRRRPRAVAVQAREATRQDLRAMGDDDDEEDGNFDASSDPDDEDDEDDEDDAEGEDGGDDHSDDSDDNDSEETKGSEPEAEVEEASGDHGRRRRPARAVAAQAREATRRELHETGDEDDEEDDDFMEASHGVQSADDDTDDGEDDVAGEGFVQEERCLSPSEVSGGDASDQAVVHGGAEEETASEDDEASTLVKPEHLVDESAETVDSVEEKPRIAKRKRAVKPETEAGSEPKAQRMRDSLQRKA